MGSVADTEIKQERFGELKSQISRNFPMFIKEKKISKAQASVLTRRSDNHFITSLEREAKSWCRMKNNLKK